MVVLAVAVVVVMLLGHWEVPGELVPETRAQQVVKGLELLSVAEAALTLVVVEEVVANLVHLAGPVVRVLSSSNILSYIMKLYRLD